MICSYLSLLFGNTKRLKIVDSCLPFLCPTALRDSSMALNNPNPLGPWKVSVMLVDQQHNADVMMCINQLLFLLLFTDHSL